MSTKMGRTEDNKFKAPFKKSSPDSVFKKRMNIKVSRKSSPSNSPISTDNNPVIDESDYLQFSK